MFDFFRRHTRVLQFLLLLGGVALFLWHADQMPLAQSSVWLAALVASQTR